MVRRKGSDAAGAGVPTATQRVVDAIQADIVERRLAPGERLREEELAARFAVSRTVIRQALNRLGQDGIVELQHNRGARVPQPGRDEAGHVFEARRLVEGEVARRLAGQLQDEQLAVLRALMQEEADADARGDRGAAIRLSGEFHRALAQLAGNPVFVRLLDELLPTTSLLLALYQPEGRPVCVAHRHDSILSALIQGSPAQAATEMRRHLQELERSLCPPAAAREGARDLHAAYRERPAEG